MSLGIKAGPHFKMAPHFKSYKGGKKELYILKDGVVQQEAGSMKTKLWSGTLANVAYTGGRMVMSVSSFHTSTCYYTQNKIDITNFSKLKMTVKSTGNWVQGSDLNMCIFPITNPTSSNITNMKMVINSTQANDITVEVDISARTGEMCIGGWIATPSNVSFTLAAYIKDIWLEP